MSERTLIDYMIGGMGTRWRWPVKHADPYTPGIADMSGFVVGVGNVFIEAKALDRWPARDGTIVKLTRYTDDQRYFLINRNGFLLLRVVRDYLLFYGAGALLKAGNVTKGELFDLALGFWKGSVDWNELVRMIKEVRPNE